jgi:hypothetical protein
MRHRVAAAIFPEVVARSCSRQPNPTANRRRRFRLRPPLNEGPVGNSIVNLFWDLRLYLIFLPVLRFSSSLLRGATLKFVLENC